MRFEAQKITPDSWTVYDLEAQRWNMPEKAVTMFMRKAAALKIAKILNAEWIVFEKNPS